MINFKTPKIRSVKYLNYISTLSCIIKMDGENCNGAPVDAHHLTCIGEGIMGGKVGDDKVLPVCRLHHGALHKIGEKAFWRIWGISPIEEARKLWKNFNKGEDGAKS